MSDIKKVRQIYIVTDAMQFVTPEDGVAIVRWVKSFGGQASLAWDDVSPTGEFTQLNMMIGPSSGDGMLTKALSGDWVIRDPHGRFRAVPLDAFEYTHEVVIDD